MGASWVRSWRGRGADRSHGLPACYLDLNQARLAVDHREQGKGVGKALLKDAILRTIQATEIAGLELLLVHDKDEATAHFYRKHGFAPVVDDPLKLFLPVPLSSG